ncbi:MAG TPA: GxxExxY protein [Pirellulaceae bacterium]|nr:GxxExxY protein [Pirellulaceae bacterium]HMP69633.1 GxxExxY protein [Pirellulaceae bacterium]
MEPQNTHKDTEFLYQRESYAIRGACFEVYKEMGPGFLEAVYQECLAKEFSRQNIPFIAQQQLSLQYKGEPLLQSYVPDFICYDKIIVEIKGTREIAPEHKAQLLNYLKATGMKLGLLVNFGHYPQIQIERMARSV